MTRGDRDACSITTRADRDARGSRRAGIATRGDRDARGSRRVGIATRADRDAWGSRRARIDVGIATRGDRDACSITTRRKVDLLRRCPLSARGPARFVRRGGRRAMATEVRAMQQAIERRNPEQARIPLEDVLVELRPEGYDEAFEADAVDVGLGGLAMRAAILPDVGSRLHCRFQSPHDGRCVDASAEVVWARDAGPSAGEFGLDQGVVSLKLEGVGPRLDADVVHRAGDVLVVEQGLPFLRLGKAVEEDGRVGRLESVDLRVEGETPRLVLTIGFDRVRASAAEEVGGDTLMDVASPARATDTPMEPRIVIPDDAEIVARRTRAEEPARSARVEEPAREARTQRAEREIEAPRVERDVREARAEREPDEAERAGEDAEAEAIARAEARRARRARRDAEAPQVVRTEKRSRESAATDEASSEERAELASSEASGLRGD
ncbi:MAG: hypothetical protein MUE69_18690, partial [Myxococcota bacterium]|nr:hypothetical protein [Myxococcota bacterium]